MAAWLLLILATAVYVAWGVVPDSALYREVLTPRVLLAIAAVLKIGYLLTGAAARLRLPRPPRGGQPGAAGLGAPVGGPSSRRSRAS